MLNILALTVSATCVVCVVAESLESSERAVIKVQFRVRYCCGFGVCLTLNVVLSQSMLLSEFYLVSVFDVLRTGDAIMRAIATSHGCVHTSFVNWFLARIYWRITVSALIFTF